MKKIMIIEDNKDLQDIYKINFEEAGYQVIIEGDGLYGISSVVEKMPDVILLDIMMPNMDGFAFLKAIKDNTNINVPVIICSNLSDHEIYDKAFSEGATAVLMKVDYSGKELVQKVGQIVAEYSVHKKSEESVIGEEVGVQQSVDVDIATRP